MPDPRHRSATVKQAKRPPHLHLHLPPRTSPPRANFSATPRPTSPTPTQNTGIRAHFAHLLPKHAVFTVTLTLHQLHNVPLVHGEFGLKWKIKGVTSSSSNGLLHKVRARKSKSKLVERPDTDNASLLDPASDTHSIANSSSTHSHSNDRLNAARGHSQPVPIPALVVSANYSSTPSSVSRSLSGTSSIASVSSASSMPPHLTGRFHNPSGHLSPAGTAAFPPNNHTPAKFFSPANGITPFVKLKEHNVLWEKTLKFTVQMSVGRDNGELGNCLAKFLVMQRVVAGDPDAPRNPCLGVVYLNLAQYADAGVITRRYLLRQSKTNATLKLSVHVEHTAGELAYVVPPLPKDEILSGVAGFLESSDVYRIRPRVSELYMRTSSESSFEVAASGSDTSSIVSGSGVSNGAHVQASGHGRHVTGKKQRRPFEIAKLPTVNDPRGTEKLIEALFNPVPVTQASKLTPFTYLVEADGEVDGDHSSYGADRAATTHDEDNRPSVMTSADGEGDDGSLYADSQSECVQEAHGLGSDFRSLRSCPSFQSSLRSKQSTRSLASKAGSKHDEDTAVSTGVLGGTERRTWWQKVLNPPV